MIKESESSYKNQLNSLVFSLVVKELESLYHFTDEKAPDLKTILKICKLKSNIKDTLKNSPDKILVEKSKISKSAITRLILDI